MKSSNAYMANYMLRRYHARRAEALAMLGGVCVDCGATKSLEFDHEDRSTKSFDVSKLWSTSRERFLAELEKCVLRCSTCHQLKSIVERGQTPARDTHGTLSSYRYCRCQLCKEAKRKHNREYSARQARLAGV